MTNIITFPPVSGGGGGGTGDATWGSITGVLNSQVDLRNALNEKQATLVSGTNIKTINGQDVLGEGDITIEGGDGVDLNEYYSKSETYNKSEVDTKIADIPGVDLSGYYDKTQTESLLSDKVDKEDGKGLSTNDFTQAFKEAVEANKVVDVTTDNINKKIVVTYSNGAVTNLNLDDVITDVTVEGAVLDATTNTLTLVSSEGGADVIVDLSLFITDEVLDNALLDKADIVHSHTASDIDGLDATLSNIVTKNEAIIGDTKTKITYDSKGLVVSGADLLDSDIPNLPQSKIINLETDLSNKQAKLVSGTNIKTINGQSVLGSGDITITGGGSGGGDSFTIEDKTKLDGIEEEATKNKTDGFLLSRSNHTGTIPMSVVENLDQTLANIELGGMTAGETLRIDGIEDSLALKADLDASGKLLASQLPDIASGRKIKVADAAARLLVDTHPDLTIAYQMDDGTSWAINGGDDPSSPDNWTELGSALISGVTSFNARTGNIMPQSGDYTAEMITESNLKQFVTAADKVSWNNRVPDAPFNGQVYGRKNGEWTIVTDGGGGTGTLSPQKEEELLERSNHTGTQGMETIDGLADALNTKADINTVYAEPMQTSYTIRSVNSTANQVHTFLLNGTNNSYGIHAYALRMTPSTAVSYSLQTTIQPAGYYGVKIPRVNGITIEPIGLGSEPYQRMTRHEEHGQTVTATTEYSSNYAVWKMFQAGDTPLGESDNWYSSRAATPTDPQIITLTLPNAVKLGSYGMVVPYNAASPRTWTFEGRLGDEGDWNIIHEATDETWDVKNQRRDYTIPTSNQGLYDQYRWVITGSNGSYFYIGRLFLYAVPAKFMIKDGDTFYSAASAELTPISGIIGSSDITVNGTDQQVIISQEAMKTLSEPYIVTDEPITVNLSIDPESEYEYANDTKITLANSYIKFSPTVSGSYKFCYQEPAP